MTLTMIEAEVSRARDEESRTEEKLQEELNDEVDKMLSDLNLVIKTLHQPAPQVLTGLDPSNLGRLNRCQEFPWYLAPRYGLRFC